MYNESFAQFDGVVVMLYTKQCESGDFWTSCKPPPSNSVGSACSKIIKKYGIDTRGNLVIYHVWYLMQKKVEDIFLT